MEYTRSEAGTERTNELGVRRSEGVRVETRRWGEAGGSEASREEVTDGSFFERPTRRVRDFLSGS